MRRLFFIFLMIVSLSANNQLAAMMINSGILPVAEHLSPNHGGGRSQAMITISPGFQDVRGAVLKTRPLPSGSPGRVSSRTIDDYLPDSWPEAALNHDRYGGHQWALALCGSIPHLDLNRPTAPKIIPPNPGLSLKIFDRVREYRFERKGWGDNCNYMPARDARPWSIFG